MDRLPGVVVPGVVGVLGVVAVAAHAAAGGGPAAGIALVVHAVAWVLATGLAWRLQRQVRVVTGAVRRARAAIDLLDDAVVVVDPGDHGVVYANRAAALLAGLPVREVVGRRVWEVGPWPEMEELATLVDGEEVRTVTHDQRILEVDATRVDWEGDRAYVLHARDVTDRDAAQRDLAERERRFRALAEDAAGVVYRIRLEPVLEVEYVSPQLVEVLGFQPSEFYVDPALVIRRARPEHTASLDLTGEDHVYDAQGVHSYSVRHAEGRWLWIEDHHTPEHDEQGRLVAVQGIAFDVSAKWETEKALGEAQRQREVAAETMHRTARVERTFLQSVSHELRTPMTSALGFARMLRDKRDMLPTAQQDSLLERLVANIERIEELVGQFLEFDRYARGDAELTRTLERLDEVVATAAEKVDLKGRHLHTDLELVMAPVDRRRIEQSVEALLRNAAEHTPPETTVQLGVTATEDHAVIIVEDDGPGVAPEVVDHVFDPFAQGPASHDAAEPGVGLGLALVRVSARLHGGEARHEPVGPHGARFLVELPLDEERTAR